MPTLAPRPPARSTTAATAAPRRRRPLARWWIALAVLAALGLHAALIVLLAWALPKWPRPPLKKGAAPAPIQLTVLSDDPTKSLHKTEVVPPPPSEYVRTPENLKTDTPPPDPKFISSEHSDARSEKPPDDPTKPLPSQDGREMPAFEFQTNPYLAGPEAHDVQSAAAAPAAESVPTPPPVNPPEAQPTPAPTPVARPTPLPEDFPTMHADPSPSNTPPEPSPTPRSTPKPTPNVQDALQRQAQRVARENPSVNSSGLVQPPGFQPQTEKTKMSGSVDNRGNSSVSAQRTPLGRYEKAISDAIGQRWYFNVDQNMSSLVRTGEVKIHFVVSRAGKILNPRVEGSNQNTALADISLEAVVKAELPPMPSDVSSVLPDGQLEVDYSFSLFEQ